MTEYWSAYRETSPVDSQECYVALADILSENRIEANAFPENAIPNHNGVAFGRYHSQSVRPFLQFFDIDIVTTSTMTAESYMDPGICLGVCFEGDWVEALDGRDIHYSAGEHAIALGTDKRREVLVNERAGSKVRVASLLIGAEFFDTYRLGEDDHSLDALQDLLVDDEPYRLIDQSHSLVLAFKQMAANPYHGAMANLHLESLALSAVVELSEHIREVNPARHQHYASLSDLTHEVRNEILQNLHSLPRVGELAARLGTNETTLRRAFKAKYGMTIMDYIRVQRLEAARIMLREGRFQIAEIAYRVGYSNPANFTNAFRRHFGYAPKFETQKS